MRFKDFNPDVDKLEIGQAIRCYNGSSGIVKEILPGYKFNISYFGNRFECHLMDIAKYCDDNFDHFSSSDFHSF